MRVRKHCQECKKLKITKDFLLSENTLDGLSHNCKQCATEQDFINNNNSLTLKTSKMATLKEKREAAALAAKTETVETPKVEKTKAVKKEVEQTTEKVETPAVEKPKVEKVKAEKAPKVKKEKVEKRKVEQLDLEGNIIETHDSIKDASTSTGVSTVQLYSCVNGKAKSAKGFRFQYEGEEVLVIEKVKKEKTEKTTEEIEDTPIEGDLDYDPELHAPKIQEPVSGEPAMDHEEEVAS